jgi:hypothetical protein
LSIGCAAGPSTDAAALHGLLELVERDAAAVWWRGGRRPRPLALEHPALADAAALLARLRQGGRGRRSWLLDITTDLGVPAVAAVSVGLDGAGFCCGLAARPGLAAACRAALLELCQMELALAVVAAKREEGGEAALNPRDLSHQARFTGIHAARCALLHPLGEPAAAEAAAPETTPAEALAGLKPAFRADGTVTAGTSSPLTDGASAVLVCSMDYARQHGLTPLAKVRSIAVAGCAPEIMGMGPVGASRKALARAGVQASQLDVVELNEAFASQALACMRELGIDEMLVNKDGGAIALGHPLGATGARIVGKAAQVLQRDGGRYALATQCIGGGQGIATLLEAV